jgi:hypothetical protein
MILVFKDIAVKQERQGEKQTSTMSAGKREAWDIMRMWDEGRISLPLWWSYVALLGLYTTASICLPSQTWLLQSCLRNASKRNNCTK